MMHDGAFALLYALLSAKTGIRFSFILVALSEASFCTALHRSAGSAIEAFTEVLYDS